MDSKPIVGIFDSDFIPFYVCYNKKDHEPKTLEECIYLCDNFIENINKAIKADYYIGYTTRGKCFRYDINPSYKANRKDAIFPPFSSQIRDYLVSKYGFKWIEGYEADDAVVSFKKQYNDKYECIIVSPDKDILNLVGTHFNPREMNYITTNEEVANNSFWSDLIVGQKGDGIAGLAGKGIKFIENRFGTNIITGGAILDEYIVQLGELEGVELFYRNYRSLKLIDTVDLGNIQLNEVIKLNSE